MTTDLQAFLSHYVRTVHFSYNVLSLKQTVHAACNFNCINENEGLLKVTRDHIHFKSGNIMYTLEDSYTVTITTGH